MKEIIYVQAGPLANYTGTHFWNTQESYFTSDQTELVSSHDPNVSFREGLSQRGEPTLCPRLLVFDRKANFGTLANTNALLGTNEDDLPDEDFPEIWNGNVMEYRQDLIPKSAYHVQLDDAAEDEKSSDAMIAQIPNDVRYWSDFNRVYYIPRTVQKLPEPAEWERPDGDWDMGQELFSRYNEDTGLMEGSLRLFLEECDSIQGVQVLNDTESFGGFVNSFLTSFRDEFVKLPCLVIPFLSDAVSRKIDLDDYQGMRKVINDARYLRGLNELSSMSIPIQSPATWPSEIWNQSLESNHSNMYHNSAILSAHIETSTLPLRLAGTHENLGSMSAQLDWRGFTPFGELSGFFPTTSTIDFDNRLVNFSTGQLERDGPKSRLLARRDITRGFSPSGIASYDRWSARLSLEDSFIARTHASAYPIPTSFPPFFKAVGANRQNRPGILAQPSAVPLFSSISTTSGTAQLFSRYATSIEGYLKRKLAVEAIGIDSDDLKELVNDLWTLHDNFNFDDGGDGRRLGDDDSGSLGEDEE